MHLTDAPGNKAGQFTSGNPFATPPEASTICDPKWLNAVQNELVAVLTAAGILPDATDTTQVAAAIDALIAAKIDNVLGRVISFVATVAYTAGEPALVGDAYFGIPRTTVAIGQTATLDLTGFFVVNKVTAEDMAVGNRLYWDDSAKLFTLDGSGSKHFAGVCNLDAAAGTMTTTIHLWANAALPPIP